MKILMITPYLPFPLHSGGQVRSYHLIKNLVKKHQIYLISLVKSEAEKKYVSELEKICARVWVFPRPASPWQLNNILRTGFSRKPFLVVRNFSFQAHRAIIKILHEEKFDLIHAETFYVMPHLPEVKTPVLLVEQTIECEVYSHFVKSLPFWFFPLKPFLCLDVMKLRWWEKYYWRQADLVAAVSDDDRKKIVQLAGELPVEVVPNGVDSQYFEKKISSISKVPTVLFVGNFKWLQNKEAAKMLLEEVWPRVEATGIRVRLLVVGRHSRGFVTPRPGVEVAEVEDIRQAYQQASVFIAPFRSGGGSRLKIFEAMASSLPVVATAKGVEGIGVTDGNHYLRGESANELAQLIVELLESPNRARKIGFEAKKFVNKHYDWRISAARLGEVYDQLTQK